MGFELLPLCPEDLPVIKKDMQEAFQMGAAAEFADLDVQILPEKDIDSSLSTKGAAAYKAVIDGQILGGAIVVIDESTKHNHLYFLYVKCGAHSRGIGQMIWYAIEKRYGKQSLHILKKEIFIFILIVAVLLLLSSSILTIKIPKYRMI